MISIKGMFGCKGQDATKPNDDKKSIFEIIEAQREDLAEVRVNPMRKILGNAKAPTMDSYSQIEDQEDFSNMTIEMQEWFEQNGTFLGFQKIAVISMHPLITKGCALPARDAVKNGYEIIMEKFDDNKKKILHKFDKKHKLNRNLIEFIRDGKKMGLRIAYFRIESDDKQYYEKPFNIDGVTRGSLKGIVQVEPIWCTPLGINTNVLMPNFYEPDYWLINGVKFHHSHLIIFKGDEVPDIIKPSYFYGGVSTTQKVWNAVFQADTIASEAVKLVQTKRFRVLKTDLERKEAVKGDFTRSMKSIMSRLNNFGFFVIDKAGGGENPEEVQQLDTSLSDFDVILNNHLQLVASLLNIPATKLLGVSPKGFGASGDYEDKNYMEEIESIQNVDLMPFLERYYEILLKSEFDCTEEFEVKFNSPYSLNELEETQVKQAKETALYTKAQRLELMYQSGSITSEEIAKEMSNEDL